MAKGVILAPDTFKRIRNATYAVERARPDVRAAGYGLLPADSPFVWVHIESALTRGGCYRGRICAPASTAINTSLTDLTFDYLLFDIDQTDAGRVIVINTMELETNTNSHVLTHEDNVNQTYFLGMYWPIDNDQELPTVLLTGFWSEVCS